MTGGLRGATAESAGTEARASGASWSGPLVAAAAVLIAMAIFVENGAYHPLSLAAVTLAIVLGAVALLVVRGAPAGAGARRWTLGVLWAGVAASLAIDALFLPGIYVDPARLGPFRPVLGLLAVLVATHAVKVAPRLERARFAAQAACFAVLAACVVRASPAPFIDVWVIEGSGARALLDGVNPYAVGYPNIYGPRDRSIADALLTPDRRYVTAFPYPPLTLLLVAPAVALASEPRWTMLAATLLAAWAVRRLGRGSPEANLAAVLLLVQPRALFVVEQSWTEPLVLAFVVAAALAVARLRERRAATATPPPGLALRDVLPVALAGAGALAAKQYAPLLLVPLAVAVPRAARGRAVLLAAAGALATMAPFVLWGPGPFLRGMVTFQLVQPFRPDALSWAAALFRATGFQAPGWIAFAAAGAVVVAASRGRVTVERALLGGALAWLGLVVLSKQAFCNYYWLAVGLLCAAIAAASRPPVAPRV